MMGHTMSIDQHDNRDIYCRMLGHEITFAYCRQGVSSHPCRRIFDCWFESFDVEKYIQEHFTDEEIRGFLAPPKPKMTTLIELIQQAQKNAKAKKPEE